MRSQGGLAARLRSRVVCLFLRVSLLVSSPFLLSRQFFPLHGVFASSRASAGLSMSPDLLSQHGAGTAFTGLVLPRKQTWSPIGSALWSFRVSAAPTELRDFDFEHIRNGVEIHPSLSRGKGRRPVTVSSGRAARDLLSTLYLLAASAFHVFHTQETDASWASCPRAPCSAAPLVGHWKDVHESDRPCEEIDEPVSPSLRTGLASPKEPRAVTPRIGSTQDILLLEVHLRSTEARANVAQVRLQREVVCGVERLLRDETEGVSETRAKEMQGRRGLWRCITVAHMCERILKTRKNRQGAERHHLDSQLPDSTQNGKQPRHDETHGGSFPSFVPGEAR